jgi:hypothetical protein
VNQRHTCRDPGRAPGHHPCLWFSPVYPHHCDMIGLHLSSCCTLQIYLDAIIQIYMVLAARCSVISRNKRTLRYGLTRGLDDDLGG